MNTDKFASSAIVQDPASQGFSVQEISDVLFKKFTWRANTSAKVNYLNEPVYKPRIYPEQIVGESIPNTPPQDFVLLTSAQIMDEFGITASEITQLRTTINGIPSFKVERSTTFPHILKITNALMRPIASNPDLAFDSTTLTTKKNILENTIQFSIGSGGYRGMFNRTGISGELSRGGMDVIKESQFAFLYDYDGGVFTCYERDAARFSVYNVSRTAPPCATCYVYRGKFGLTVSSDKWKSSGTTANIYFSEGQVIIGKTISLDPTLSLDVRGIGSIDSVLTTSLETYSDRRLKENIRILPQTSNVLNLNAYLYNYIDKPGPAEIGLIAQEVEAEHPEIVKEHNGFKTVQYDRIGVLLLPIVKAQQAQIDTLNATVEDLKMLIAKLI
jgi:hypothetical protein